MFCVFHALFHLILKTPLRVGADIIPIFSWSDQGLMRSINLQKLSELLRVGAGIQTKAHLIWQPKILITILDCIICHLCHKN